MYPRIEIIKKGNCRKCERNPSRKKGTLRMRIGLASTHFLRTGIRCTCTPSLPPLLSVSPLGTLPSNQSSWFHDNSRARNRQLYRWGEVLKDAPPFFTVISNLPFAFPLGAWAATPYQRKFPRLSLSRPLPSAIWTVLPNPKTKQKGYGDLLPHTCILLFFVFFFLTNNICYSWY
jgi:hypothetical protein